MLKKRGRYQVCCTAHGISIKLNNADRWAISGVRSEGTPMCMQM